MIRQPMLVLATLFAASFVGAAYGAQPQAAEPTTKAAPDPSERICKDIGPTGSRLVTRRICATRAEWEQRELQDKEQTKLMQRPQQTCVMMNSRRC